ncbi:MAG: redoxin domain-containing protein [Bacteroidetes bacterium]|nr:MAG: redoxin domain-containing protein [Bacteroidota bacterium]
MKNKKYFLRLISFSLSLYSCGNIENENFQVKGKLSNSKGEFVTLVNENSSEVKTIDSVQMNERGEFIFTKKVPEKGFYSIRISSSNFTTIIADSTENITLEGNAQNLNDSSKVSGSPDTELFFKFNETTKKKFKAMEAVRIQQDSIRKVFEAYMNNIRDTLRIDSLSRSLEPVFNAYSANYRKQADDVAAFIKKFIDENTHSFVSLAAIQMLSPNKDIAYFIKVADALSAKYPDIETLKDFKTYVDKEKKLAQGMPAPGITMNDKDGTPLSLSSMKGKVVIVDFWASWCKPCRAENPFVVSIYNKYKNKGLGIFSVSLDQDKGDWLEAIKHDNLAWKDHVCDFKMWQSPVVAQYGFTGIPFAVLLDREGNIAEKNLRGPALEEKIKELLDGNP